MPKKKEKSEIETHISTTQDVKEKLRSMAKKEARTMRVVLRRIISEAYDKVNDAEY